MSMNQSAAQLVVIRFMDGHVLKGTTRDFAPDKARFHLFPSGDEEGKALDVVIGSLKAIFFVKSHEGNPGYVKDNSFERARGQGRRLVVTFKDGEMLAGFSMGYDPNSQGFFLIPADPDSNNSRAYILNSALKKVEPAIDEAPPDLASSAT
jgi:hypothetical protein